MTREQFEAKYASSKPCACEECVSCCLHRPCWPTPWEADKLMDEGFADRLMVDYWVSLGGGNIDVIAPAIVGHEGRIAPSWPAGRCTFLTLDHRCLIHDVCKPVEGRVYSCSNCPEDLHEDVSKIWNNEPGRDVVARWQELTD